VVEVGETGKMVVITGGPELLSVYGQSIFPVYAKDGGIKCNAACFVVIQVKDGEKHKTYRKQVDIPVLSDEALLTNGWEPFGED
jgi:hypothetical protein